MLAFVAQELERSERARAEALEVARKAEAENERLKRACAEGLPREVILCPACGKRHVDGANGEEFATRPHHTHLCQYCGNVWDREVWSFGAAEGEETVPSPDALARLTRERDDARGDYDAVNFDAARVVEAWEELASAEQHDVHQVYFGRLAKRVEELRDHGFGRWWVDAVKDGPREPPSTALRAQVAVAEAAAAEAGRARDAALAEAQSIVGNHRSFMRDLYETILAGVGTGDPSFPKAAKAEEEMRTAFERWEQVGVHGMVGLALYKRGEDGQLAFSRFGTQEEDDAYIRTHQTNLAAMMVWRGVAEAAQAEAASLRGGGGIGSAPPASQPAPLADGQLPEADVVPWLVFGVKYEGIYSEGELAAALGLYRLDVRELALKGRAVAERLRDERVARVRAEVGRPPETPEERAVHEARALANHTFHGQRLGQGLFNALVRLDEDFAEGIRGTSDDPFHDDGRFLAALRLWRQSIEERTRAGGAE